ncbi:hypothetical protein ACFL35_20565 [Candidatus Riflebacteria bacterium]
MRNETKEKRFKRVVERRVQNILDNIRKLSQCSNKRMYLWNEGQLEKIWQAIDEEVKRTKKCFVDEDPGIFQL